MIIMNMQNKLYTIQFLSPHNGDDQSTASPRAEITDPLYFTNFTKFPKKAELLEKFKLPDKRGLIWTHRNKKQR